MRYFTWASYFMYFLGGMVSVVFGAVLPKWLAFYHVSYATGGFVVLLQACGFMLGVPFATFFMRRLHYRYVLAGAALAVGFAQFVLTLTPSLYFVFVVVIISGIGASALETAVASYVMEVFVGQRAVYMSRLEVAFGLGALLTPSLASLLIRYQVWQLSFATLAFVGLVLAGVWLFIRVDLHDATDETQLDAKSEQPPDFSNVYWKYGVLSIFLVLIFAYVGLEGSLNNFLPVVFITNFHQPAANASLSVAMMWLAMVAGRMAIGKVVRRVNYERYVFSSIVMTVLFLALLVVIPWAWVSYVDVLCVGFGMSAIYSLTMVYATHTFPGMTRSVTSLVTLFAGVGGAVFPGMIGYAMDHIAPSQTPWLFLAISFILLVALMSIFTLVRLVRMKSVNLRS